MEVTVISREMIHPSTPTPSHLKHFKLSLFDQHFTPLQIPTIYHYPTVHPYRANLAKLRDSLAKTLSIYYPFAGRIRDHKSIDCNDEGALLVEARVKGNMSDFLKQPNVIDNMFEFVPSLGDETGPENKLVQVGVQVNVFSCGGVSICLCFLHKIADGGTVNGFTKCFAAFASGREQDNKESMFPDLSSASSLFPPKEELPLGLNQMHPSFVKEGTSLQRRFVFNGHAIAALQAKAAASPSRALAVACFIWEQIMNASETLEGFKRPSVLALAKDLRPHTVPPLPEFATGNIYWVTLVPCTHNMELEGLVGLVKERVAAIDTQFVQKLQGEGGFDIRSKYIEEDHHQVYRRGNPDTILVSPVNKFRFTELDFGWGKPIWINHLRGSSDPEKSKMYVSTVHLGETGCGDDGIEAWLVLGDKVMKLLENCPEFIRFAKSNPPTSSL